ncbi:MAG: fibronectin type III-like domain-contianing protein, partial [Muribaculaceae bacterium]|nr:fibronectin type III-like domain-contianing protein [Muribaculaceae bacterium]
YIRDVAGSVARPVKELKHFERISLKPGESRRVDFTITPETLRFYDYNLDYKAEPGKFEVMVGPDSQRLSILPFIMQ